MFFRFIHSNLYKFIPLRLFETSQYVSEMQETCYVDPLGAVWTDHDVLQNSAALPTHGAHSDSTSLLDNPNPRTPRAPLLSPGASLCLSHPIFPLDFFAFGHICQEYVKSTIHFLPAKLPPRAVLENVTPTY